MAFEADKASAADVLRECFGQGGDFTITVEESAGEEAGEDGAIISRSEFRVWSVLLTKWSKVFDKMINSNSFCRVCPSPNGHQRFLCCCRGGVLAFPLLWSRRRQHPNSGGGWHTGRQVSSGQAIGTLLSGPSKISFSRKWRVSFSHVQTAFRSRI